MKPLIISNNPFSSNTNNGKTLESIFDNPFFTNISQLYFTDYLQPDFHFCNNYFRISDKDVFKNLVFWTENYGGEIKKNTPVKNFNEHQLIKSKNKYIISHLIRDLLWSFNSWKTQKMIKWAKEVKPDFIFFVAGGDRFSHKVAIYISKILQVPLVTYFTDDYLLNNSFGIFNFILRKRQINYFKKLVKNSNLCYTICSYMSEEYSKYFKKNFGVLINCVNVSGKFRHSKISRPVIINYFGSLHSNRWKMLIRFSKIIKTKDSKDIVLNVYTNTEPEHYILKNFEESNINYKGFLMGDILKLEMCNSDFLLHIESDDKKSISQTILSVSTKIPEYLSTSRPIIGFGPLQVASIKLLQDNNIGFIFSSSDSDTVNADLFNNIVLDTDKQYIVALNGYNYVIENFDKTKQQNYFYKQINNLLNTI